jgi:hypothetical protein
MEKGFFHPDRGYWQTLTDPSDQIRATNPEGTVETPLQPTPIHVWDGSQWQEPSQSVKDEYAAAQVRNRRDYLLMAEVDPIASNALRWSSLTADQQQAWAGYRQALLDITKQAGFPHNVTWPSKPE